MIEKHDCSLNIARVGKKGLINGRCFFDRKRLEWLWIEGFKSLSDVTSRNTKSFRYWLSHSKQQNFNEKLQHPIMASVYPEMALIAQFFSFQSFLAIKSITMKTGRKKTFNEKISYSTQLFLCFFFGTENFNFFLLEQHHTHSIILSKLDNNQV